MTQWTEQQREFFEEIAGQIGLRFEKEYNFYDVDNLNEHVDNNCLIQPPAVGTIWEIERGGRNGKPKTFTHYVVTQVIHRHENTYSTVLLTKYTGPALPVNEGI